MISIEFNCGGIIVYLPTYKAGMAGNLPKFKYATLK